MNTKRFTDRQIIDAIRQSHGCIYIAAQTLGCHADTIRKRARVSRPVALALDAIRGHLVDTTELMIRRAVIDGEAWALRFVARTLGRLRGYSERPDCRADDLYAVDGNWNPEADNPPRPIPPWERSGKSREPRYLSMRDIARAMSQDHDFVDYFRLKAAQEACRKYGGTPPPTAEDYLAQFKARYGLTLAEAQTGSLTEAPPESKPAAASSEQTVP